MKISAIILGLCFSVIGAIAQEIDNDEREAKTLLSKYNEIKGFGALDIKLTDIASKQAMVVGAYGGVIVNKQVMLGLGGYGFTSSINVTREGGEEVSLEGGYGGMMLGFIIAPREIVHVTVPLFLGAGSFHTLNEQIDFNNFPREIILESSSFAVIEPGLQLELNISKNVRLNLGASYRLIQGSNLRGIKDADLSNWAGNVTVKIGRF